MGKHGILLQYILILPIFYMQLIQISIGYTISESRQARGLERGDASNRSLSCSDAPIYCCPRRRFRYIIR